MQDTEARLGSGAAASATVTYRRRLRQSVRKRATHEQSLKLELAPSPSRANDRGLRNIIVSVIVIGRHGQLAKAATPPDEGASLEGQGAPSTRGPVNNSRGHSNLQGDPASLASEANLVVF